MYEKLGPGGYRFMVGRMGWTIAKTWAESNASDPYISPGKKRIIAEMFHKSLGNVEQAIKDTWARYRYGGREAHILRRYIGLPGLRTTHHPARVGTGQRPNPEDGPVEEMNDLMRIRFPPRAEELLRKAKKKKKVPYNREWYEGVRKDCMLFVEQYVLQPGQVVLVSGGGPYGILDVSISYLHKGVKPTELEGREKGHRYEVVVSSSVRGVLSEEITFTTGSTALEAMTKAMRKLEDVLRPSVPPKRSKLQRTKEGG